MEKRTTRGVDALAEQAMRLSAAHEVVNYAVHGDARGPGYLASQPDAAAEPLTTRQTELAPSTGRTALTGEA